MTRPERPFAAGDRVRFDAPGWSFHGDLGSVAMDTAAESVLYVLRDRYAVEHPKCAVFCATSEVEMLEDQTPNLDHFPEADEASNRFWWMIRELQATRRRMDALVDGRRA